MQPPTRWPSQRSSCASCMSTELPATLPWWVPSQNRAGKMLWFHCHTIGKDVKRGFTWFCLLPVPTLEKMMMQNTLVSPQYCAVSYETWGRMWRRGGQASGIGPCWWRVSMIQCLSVLPEYFSGILFEHCSGGSCLLKWGTGRWWEGFGSCWNFRHTHGEAFWNT